MVAPDDDEAETLTPRPRLTKKGEKNISVKEISHVHIFQPKVRFDQYPSILQEFEQIIYIKDAINIDFV